MPNRCKLCLHSSSVLEEEILRYILDVQTTNKFRHLTNKVNKRNRCDFKKAIGYIGWEECFFFSCLIHVEKWQQPKYIKCVEFRCVHYQTIYMINWCINWKSRSSFYCTLLCFIKYISSMSCKIKRRLFRSAHVEILNTGRPRAIWFK